MNLRITPGFGYYPWGGAQAAASQQIQLANPPKGEHTYQLEVSPPTVTPPDPRRPLWAGMGFLILILIFFFIAVK